MNRFIRHISILGLVSLSLVFGKGTGYCPQGMFQPEVDGPCRPCTTCPENQIVRETCDKNRDTQCGSFTEFKLFHSSLKLTDPENSSVSGSEPVPKFIHTHNVVTTEADEENESWHSVTMAMIALLCITGILFLLFVSLVCYRSRRMSKDGFITQVDRDSDFERVCPENKGRSQSPRATTSRDETEHGQMEQFEIAIDSDNT